MHLRTITALLAAPCVAAALTGCSSEASEPSGDDTAVAAGVQEQYDVLAEELAEKGHTVESGEWTVNLITEAAEPWYELHEGGHTSFREPQAGETNHIEIIPVETATGRIVPDVPITLEVLDDKGKVVQKERLSFYYSTFFHYATNFSIPEGSYSVRATLEAPDFYRHGVPDEHPALTEGATVTFEDIELGTE